MEILKFGDFVNEDNSSINGPNLGHFYEVSPQHDVKRILVQELARPNFAEGTFGSKPKSLRDMIQDLEYLIEEYKTKM